MVVEAQRRPPSQPTSQSAQLGLAPDAFLELIQTDPTEAFRLIFPDYPLERKRVDARKATPSREESERVQERPVRVTPPAAKMGSIEAVVSETRPRYQQTGRFDVHRSRGDSGAESQHSRPHHTTSAFHTEFAQHDDAPSEGQDQEGVDEDEGDTRRLIHKLVIDAQHRTASRTQSQDLSSNAHDSSPSPEEEIEEDMADFQDCSERCEVAVSPPSSPSSTSREQGPRQKNLLVPTRDMTPSPHHLSPSSFTISASAPASPAHSDEPSDDEWTL